jgi:hypothetical protein
LNLTATNRWPRTSNLLLHSIQSLPLTSIQIGVSIRLTVSHIPFWLVGKFICDGAGKGWILDATDTLSSLHLDLS